MAAELRRDEVHPPFARARSDEAGAVSGLSVDDRGQARLGRAQLSGLWSEVQIRRHFIVTNYVLALVISVGAGYAVGNRDEALVSLTLLLWFPVLWGMVLVSFWLFPIDVAMVRPGWTPGDSEVDRELERLFASLRERGVVIRSTTPELPAPEPDALTDDAPGGRLPLSTLKDPPVTLEGVMIAIAVTAVLAYELYTALEPHF